MRVYQFKDLFGNFGSLSMLKSSIKNGTVPNFTLMAGESGTGKSSTAEILALALTCENRVDEEPCLKCDSCRKNVLALQGKANSSQVKKINLGLNNNKEDVDKLISEVFRLERSEGNTVFILEEVHSLDDLRQTSLLEEIDKLDKNVYVILCTTKSRKLLEELKNRAITFNFSNLKSSDSKLLLEKILINEHVRLDDNVKDLILKKSRGTPRVIVNLVNFIKDNPCDYQSILNFLGEINPQLFNILLRSCSDMNSYYIALQDLIRDYSIADILYALKAYLLDMQFLSRGVSMQHANMTRSDSLLAKELGNNTLYKIQTVIHSMDSRCSEPDFVFNMLKVRMLVVSQLKNNESNSSNQGVAQSPSIDLNNATTFSSLTSNAVENHINAEQKRKFYQNSESAGVTKLDRERFLDILNGDKK